VVCALSLGIVLALGGFAAWAWIDAHLPRIFRFEDYAASALQVTRVLAADGSVIDELFIERRTVVALEAVPKHLRDAVIAAEDADFYAHRGVDPMGIARALYRDVAEGRFAQGGSTITQQVARTFYLTAEKTLLRKAREAVLAFKLERELTKDAILALYLNQIYFGHGRWGVQEAARLYFGADVQSLGLAESALIAGVIQSPGRLSPFVDPEAARARRHYVLQQMVTHGLASPAAARDAERAPLPVAPGPLQPIPVAAGALGGHRDRRGAARGSAGAHDARSADAGCCRGRRRGGAPRRRPPGARVVRPRSRLSGDHGCAPGSARAGARAHGASVGARGAGHRDARARAGLRGRRRHRPGVARLRRSGRPVRSERRRGPGAAAAG
jgi:membrane peptidoglycan carboxypeptidase